MPNETSSASNLSAEPRVDAEARLDGSQILRSAIQLGSSAPSLAYLFIGGAGAHPARRLIAERSPWTPAEWTAAAIEAGPVWWGLEHRPGKGHSLDETTPCLPHVSIST
jgi:hypothetical protein